MQRRTPGEFKPMKKPLFLFLVMTFFLIACASKQTVSDIHYYDIDIPVPPANYEQPLTTASYRVLPLQIDPAYETQQIAIRDIDRRIRYFSRHLWRERPAVMLDSLLQRYFESRNLLVWADSPNWKEEADYFIRPHIYQLLIIKTEENLEAHLFFELELIENLTDKVVVSSALYSSEKMESGDLNLFAGLISRMLTREFESFSGRVRSYFQKQTTAEKQ